MHIVLICKVYLHTFVQFILLCFIGKKSIFGSTRDRKSRGKAFIDLMVKWFRFQYKVARELREGPFSALSA